MKGRLLLVGVPLLFCIGLLGVGWVLRVRAAGQQDTVAQQGGSGRPVKATPVVVIGPDSSGIAAAPKVRSSDAPGKSRELTMKDYQENSTEKDFMKLFQSAEQQAKVEVETLLKSKGGPAALAHIQNALEHPETEPLQVVKSYFLARLIAFVAQRSPESGPAAADLTRKLLASTSDEWVRIQLMAGALGFPSTAMSFTEPIPGRPIRWSFSVEEPGSLPSTNPLRASLAGLMKSDPTLTSIVMGWTGDAHEPAARRLAALAMGTLPLVPGSLDALKELARSDPFDAVRASALKSLAQSGGVDGRAYVLAAAGDASLSEGARNTAIGALPTAVPYDRRVDELFRSQLSDPAAAAQRPALADAGLRYLSQDRANTALREHLLTLLGQEATNESIVQLYVQRIMAAGLSEFIPTFRALEAAQTDPEAKEVLSSAVKQIEHCEEYSTMSSRLAQIQKTMKEMEVEYHAPQTSPQRQADLVRQLKDLGNEYSSVNQKRNAILTDN